jgi:hypothetical protein
MSDVDELVAAAVKFTVPLRMGDGMDEIALNALRQALRRCADAWRHEVSIPKRAAHVLVDLFPAIEGDSHLYEEDYAKLVRDVALEISDLVTECVALDPSVGEAEAAQADALGEE